MEIFNKTNAEQNTKIVVRASGGFHKVYNVALYDGEEYVGARNFAERDEAIAYAEVCYVGKPVAGDCSPMFV